MPVEEIAHNNMNNYVREMHVPHVSFAATGFQELYVSLPASCINHRLMQTGA